MRILFICDEYPPGKHGGIGTSVQLLSRELVNQGHQVFVAGLYSYNYGQKEFEIDDGVNVWRLRYGPNFHLDEGHRLYHLFDKLPNTIKSHLNGKRAFSKFINFIDTLITTERIDMIEIADYNNFCQHIGFVATWPKFKIPLIVKSHGSHTYFCEEQGISPIHYLHKTDIELYKRADALSSVSKYTADKNKKLFGIKQPIEILYNGIPVSDINLNQSNNPETVIYTGSITSKKGIFSLVKAWNGVYKKNPQSKLIILGKGKTKNASSLLDADAKKSVEFKGHVDRSLLFSMLEKATLAVFPSYSETFGLGVVEAMSLGCPVIYTKRSCGPEIVRDEIDGLLVDPDNIDEITAKISLLLENASLRTKLADTAFESVKLRFNIKHIAAAHIAFYNKVILNFKK